LRFSTEAAAHFGSPFESIGQQVCNFDARIWA
jgi:hypothetical protein